MELGFVLIQWEKIEGQENIQLPVAYASRLLKAVEKNYSTVDRKGLVVVWAVKHFKLYIIDMYFKIITDHNMLKALQNRNELEEKWLN